MDIGELKIENIEITSRDIIKFEIDRIETYYKVIAIIGAIMFGLGLII